MSNLPQFADSVDLSVFIEPLGGPVNPRSYLDRFPEEVYNKSPDSHLVRFMYVLLGPSGVGWLKKNLLEARLALEDHGFELFDLERFYGDPFSFGRILEELYDEDPLGVLTREQWDRIKAKDEAFRSRAINYFNAARLGTTPQGMELAARAGIGHSVEIVENYKYLFDAHSDHTLGLKYQGNTTSTQEFVIVPRQETSRTEVQTIAFEAPLDGGFFTLVFDGHGTASIAYNATSFDVQTALRALPNIGSNAVMVAGGPAPNPFVVTFTGTLANQNVPLLQAISGLTDSTASGVGRPITVTTTIGGLDANDEIVSIPARDQHGILTALDYLRPVGSIPTMASGQGTRTRQNWTTIAATSDYTEVAKYVTGSPNVAWPPVNAVRWIEAGVEKQAPRVQNDRQYHYVGFHNVAGVTAYTDEALTNPSYESDSAMLAAYNSVHAGPFIDVARVMSFFAQYTDPDAVFTADRALADYAEPLTVTTIDDASRTAFVNGVYPQEYSTLSGVARVRYNDDQFWSSRARSQGAEFLELDLGEVNAVNFLSFEVVRKPIDIEIDFDLLDQSPARRFVPVRPLPHTSFPDSIHYDPANENPWQHVQFYFDDGAGNIPFTRYLRIKIGRRADSVSTVPRFLYNPATAVQSPWGVEVRNLRVGRNVV